MFDTPRESKRRKTEHAPDGETIGIDTPRQTRSGRKAATGVTPVSTRKTAASVKRQEAIVAEDVDELGNHDVTTNGNTTMPTTTPRRTPRTRKQDTPIVTEDEEPLTEVVVKSVEKPTAGRSSGRQRKAPRRFSPELRRSTPRNSVARRTPVVEHAVEESTKTPASTTRRRLRFDVPAEPVIEVPPPSPPKSSRDRWKTTLVVEETPDMDFEVARDSAEEAKAVEEEARMLADEMDLDEVEQEQDVGVVEEDTEYTAAKDYTYLEDSMAIQVPNGLSQSTIQETTVEDPPDIAFLRQIVLGKLTGRRHMRLVDLEDEHRKVHHLVEQTVVAGEGNSMLIIGARGTGKTALVNAIVQDLSRAHSDHFHVIRLNGFIHTDDKLALREIWRQLGREMDIEEEETGQVKNYADTLATLLALLSHPAEQGRTDGDAAAGTETAKSVVFIMDEFDLFAAHPRQTLLYNLFDIAQARKAPIAVLGLTTRVDAAESLEKRVKSRFSHRYVHLSLAKNLPSFMGICKAALRIDFEELGFDERSKLAKLSGLIRHDSPTGVKKHSYAETLETWNTAVDALLLSPTTTSFLTSIYRTTKSIPAALTSFLLPITLLQTSKTPAPPPPFPLSTPDSKLTTLASLPTLPLILLISSARLNIVLDTPLTNFNMAYAEYLSIAQRARIAGGPSSNVGGGLGGRVWGRDVARTAWEVLAERDLLVSAGGAGSAGGGHGARGNEMWRVDVALEEIEGAVSGGGEVEEGLLRWCREI